MKNVTIMAALIALPTLASAQDMSPDAWILSASCNDVLEVMANPLATPDGRSPFTGAGYVGAVMGFSEAYRLALSPETKSTALRREVFGICQSKPDTPFKDVVAASLTPPVASH